MILPAGLLSACLLFLLNWHSSAFKSLVNAQNVSKSCLGGKERHCSSNQFVQMLFRHSSEKHLSRQEKMTYEQRLGLSRLEGHSYSLRKQRFTSFVIYKIKVLFIYHKAYCCWFICCIFFCMNAIMNCFQYIMEWSLWIFSSILSISWVEWTHFYGKLIGLNWNIYR